MRPPTNGSLRFFIVALHVGLALYAAGSLAQILSAAIPTF